MASKAVLALLSLLGSITLLVILEAIVFQVLGSLIGVIYILAILLTVAAQVGLKADEH